MAFDQHQIAGILDDPATLVLHEPGTFGADVGAAGLEEYVVERRLIGKVVDALGRRREGWRFNPGCGELGRRPGLTSMSSVARGAATGTTLTIKTVAIAWGT